MSSGSSAQNDPVRSGDSVFLYAQKADVNEATFFYIATIEKALSALGKRLVRVDRVSDIPHGAEVLVIDCKHAMTLVVMRPTCKFWLWLQGIVPEEAELQLGSKLRRIYWTGFERISIPRARGVFMVSSAMAQHYSEKYGFRRLNTFIMPCVNQRLCPESFSVPHKYSTPRFVYAGSLHRWQCVDETLKAYIEIKKRIPAASLTLFTGDQSGAKQAIERLGAEDVRVGYCPPSELQRSLAEFKYGFTLRQPHPVNKVSTPTKVSSYMAAGVIPIITTAIADYSKQLSSVNPLIITDSVSPEAVLNGVLQVEAQTLSSQGVLAAYSEVFDRYLDLDSYIGGIETFLKSTGMSTS